MPIKTESFDYENKGEYEALRNMKNEIELSVFSDLVCVNSEDLRAALGLDIEDEGSFYILFLKVWIMVVFRINMTMTLRTAIILNQLMM